MRGESPGTLRIFRGVEGVAQALASDAAAHPVRPEQLHLVGAERLVLPGADITDLAIGVVVPPLAGNRVRDRLGEPR